MSWGELLEIRDTGDGSSTLAKEGLFLSYVFKLGSANALGQATNPLFVMAGAANNYVQGYILNTTNGASASSDLIAYPSNGSDAHGWVDIGITSPSYADATYTCTGGNEAYLFGSGPTGTSGTGNLVIATDNTGTANAIQMYTGGFTQAKTAYKFQIDSAGNVITKPQTTPPTLNVNGDMVFNLTSNTNLRISVRGTDGVTRTANITLA